jgi:hypothetical protein
MIIEEENIEENLFEP